MGVDLSHCGDQTTLDALEAANKPVLCTHATCRTLIPGPFLELLLELSERISQNVIAEHFLPKPFEYFPFEAVLSDVQAVLADSPGVLQFHGTPATKVFASSRQLEGPESACTPASARARSLYR